jgi:hypothetical protein
MNKKESLFEDFSSRPIGSRRTVAFNLMYKGIEIEGKFTEYFNDLYDEWDRTVEIEDSEGLTDEDIELIEEYVLDKI